MTYVYMRNQDFIKIYIEYIMTIWKSQDKL
jgi:hypothetical protein